MKKALALILVLFSIATICACSKKGDDNNTGDTGSISTKDTDNTPSEKSFQRGTVENNTYTSTFIGLKLKLDDSWTFSSDEEMLEMMDLGSELLSDQQKLAAEISKQQTVYDAMAQQASGSNVIIMFENMSLTDDGNSYDETRYAEVLKQQLDLSDLTYSYDDLKTIKIADENYLLLSTKTEYNSVQIEQSFLIRKIDSYMAVICITSFPDVDTTISVQNIIAHFEKA